MIQLHATKKLFQQLPLAADGTLPSTPRSQWLFDQPPLESNPLSGWHGNLITLQRRKCILLVHDQTRFPVFLPALKKAGVAELNDRFVDGFMNTLLKCGADDAQMESAQRRLRPLRVDTSCDRSVQGTSNWMRQYLEHAVMAEGINLAETLGYGLGAVLADIPYSVRGRKGYIYPDKEMLALLAALDAG